MKLRNPKLTDLPAKWRREQDAPGRHWFADELERELVEEQRPRSLWEHGEQWFERQGPLTQAFLVTLLIVNALTWTAWVLLP